MRKFALLCPGQGGQNEHLFSLASTNDVAAALLAKMDAQHSFGLPLQQILNSPGQMFDNQFAQPLIVAASLANWIALCSQSEGQLPAPELIAGYSIGEISAHAISGEISVEEAVNLAHIRAQAMQACIEPNAAQRMMAVSGIHLDILAPFCQQQRLHIAIVTGDSNAIIAGLNADILVAEQILRTHPLRQLHLSVLPVHIASHTPLMDNALPALKQALNNLAWHKPLAPVVAGVNAMKMMDSVSSKQSLLAQMTQAIRWHECMDTLHEAGIQVVLELGPGAALSRMLQARHPHIACRSVADFRRWSAVTEWVRRQMLAD